MGQVKGREYPSVARWRASRARKQVLRKLKNKLQWRKVALPKDWETWDETKQLAWAREVLASIASGEDNGKTRALAASALARSLEPKRPATPSSPTQPSQDGSTGQPKSKEYLLAVKAEIEAKLDELEKNEH